MTDDHSRLARLEERIDRMEAWCKEHGDLDTRIALVEKSILAYNGSVRHIQEDMSAMHDTLTGWKASIGTLKYILGAVGFLSVLQIILRFVGF